MKLLAWESPSLKNDTTWKGNEQGRFGATSLFTFVSFTRAERRSVENRGEDKRRRTITRNISIKEEEKRVGLGCWGKRKKISLA